MAPRPITLEYALSKVWVSPTGCWEWQGRLEKGYGRLGSIRKKRYMAHRFVYEKTRGPIPDGLTLDHLCRNRCCVNPAHLEPVTATENILRGENPAAKNKRKTHCNKGHSLESAYLIKGKRYCIPCLRARTKQYREKAHA